MPKQFKKTRTKKNNFTPEGVKRIKPEDERFEVAEPTGLRLRVGLRSKSWCYRFRNPVTGKSDWISLGRYPEVDLTDARNLMLAARSKVEQGFDPHAFPLVSKEKAKEAPTVGELVNEYLTTLPKLNRSNHQVEPYLHRIADHWGRAKVTEISRREVKKLYDKSRKNAPVAGRKTLQIIKRLFNYAVEMEYLELNPALAVKSVKSEKPGERSRVLSDKELVSLWGVLSEPGVAGRGTRLALALCLVTGQRIGECRQGEWKNLDSEWRTWTIPAHISKNKRAHEVPLSDLARETLKFAKEISGDSPYFFPSRAKKFRGARHISKETPKHLLDDKRDKGIMFLDPGKEPYTPHDLRRTVATRLRSLGVPRDVIKRVLNHTEQDVTAIYDRHSYDAEKRDALTRWEGLLRDIVAGKSTSIDSTVADLHNRFTRGDLAAAFDAVRMSLEARRLPPEWALIPFLNQWRNPKNSAGKELLDD